MSRVEQTSKTHRQVVTFVVATTSVLLALHSTFAQEKSDEELVKELSNPVASLISVPFQSNFEFKLGPNNDGFRYTLNFQPVVPISLTKDWNVIVRTIVPIIDQTDVIAPNTSQGGLSDITQSFFFSPKRPVAGMTVGVGPAFLYPAATDDALGSEKWGAGPTFVVLKQVGGWTYGMLFNHIWSFAGNEHRTYVSSTFFQPFIAYATKTKTTFTVNTESTYDWHNDQLTAPINFTVAQLTKSENSLCNSRLAERSMHKVRAVRQSGGSGLSLHLFSQPEANILNLSK
jgi:hypothetical protein